MTPRRFLTRWLPVNGTFAGLAVYGGLAGAAWAVSIVTFLAWAMCISMLILLFLVELADHLSQHPEFNWSNVKTQPVLPKSWAGFAYALDVAYDLAITAFMMSMGWNITAVAYLLHTVCVFFVIRAGKRIIERHQAFLRTRAASFERYRLEVTRV